MKNIFIDFDNCCINSTLIVTAILNERYNKKVEWEDIKQYDFSDKFPEVTKKEIKEIFDSREFFKLAEFAIFPNAIRVIERLCGDFNVSIVSIGSSENIRHKIKFLKDKFPFIKNYIMLVKEDNIMDKSVVRMGKEDWMIDDVYSNLETSTAGNRILFSYANIKTSWNQYGKHIELTPSWKDIERRIYGE